MGQGRSVLQMVMKEARLAGDPEENLDLQQVLPKNLRGWQGANKSEEDGFVIPRSVCPGEENCAE